MIRDCSTEEVSQVLDQATVRRVLDALRDELLLDALRDELRRVLLTPEEAAKALSISPRRLWDLTQRGEIAAVNVPGWTGSGDKRRWVSHGRNVRYRLETLKQWAERNERKGLTG